MTIDNSEALLSRITQLAGRELTFVSIAGQGGAVAAEVLCAALARRGWFTSVRMRTTGERRMAPVINDIKLARVPVLPNCANERPAEMLLFTEALFANQHPWILDTMQTLTRGVLMVNTALPVDAVPFPFPFEGTVAVVDATKIAERVLGIRPAPVGLVLAGLYARATGAVDVDAVCDAIRERFPGKVGDGNAAGAREAYETVRIASGVTIAGNRERKRRRPIDAATLSDRRHLAPVPLTGASEGNSALAWRSSLPTVDETKCTCRVCVTPTFCPEGVISWEDGRYRVNYEYCKGCGICAEVCVHGAVQMGEAATVLSAGARACR